MIFAVVGLALYFPRLEKRKTVIVQENLAAVNPVVSQVNTMSLDEKIGQMLIVGFEHQYLDEHIRSMITRYHIGGINLLGRNVRNRNQVKKLTADLQKIATIPLFIATDQEGGVIVRFNFLDELTPQIRIKNVYQAEQVAISRARQLLELGVNMNFSPVLDYVSNSKSYLYNRTFGTSSSVAGELGSAMIRGYKKGGVIPVAKHFPGYGNLFSDPHKSQAVLDISREELKLDLIPFQKIIEDNSAVAIMTAHIWFKTRTDTHLTNLSGRHCLNNVSSLA